jgi:hypothetical protein
VKVKAIVVAALAFGAASCASAPASRPAPPPKKPPPRVVATAPTVAQPPTLPELEVETGATVADISVPRELVLLDAGAEPRRQLRYSPTAGQEEIVELVDDGAPLVRYYIRLAVRVVSVDDHWIAFTAAGTAAEEQRSIRAIPPARSTAEGFANMHVTGVMDRHGNVRSLGASMVGLLATLDTFRSPLIPTIPLPSEPVGVGARWEVRTKGPRLEYTTTYTVAELGDRTRLTAARVYTAADGKPLPDGTTWTATETVELDPDQMCVSVHGEGSAKQGVKAVPELWDAIVW